MTYIVNGYIDGVSYQATVGGDQTDASIGAVTGSPNVLGLLSGNDGHSFSRTVTGQAVKLDVHDPDTILHALQELTEVTSVEGDAPEADAPFDPGVIY